MHPYKIVTAQELSERDCGVRVRLCQDLKNIRPEDVVIFSDEAHFHLSGTVNSQNCRYWSEHNPQELHQRPLHSPKVTVWCAVYNSGVMGPYFFEENDRNVTVNSERYCAMLRDFFQPKLRELFGERENVWFQQDGATAHTARQSLALVNEMFPGHVISLRGDIGWPPRSPDLTPCDFFLWGYLKSKVYEQRPQSLRALKEAITQEVEAIPPEMTQRVMDNFRERLNQCINSEGSHLRDVLFKK